MDMIMNGDESTGRVRSVGVSGAHGEKIKQEP